MCSDSSYETTTILDFTIFPGTHTLNYLRVVYLLKSVALSTEHHQVSKDVVNHEWSGNTQNQHKRQTKAKKVDKRVLSGLKYH